MSNDNKEAKKEELLEKQEARQLTEEELEQVTGGTIVRNIEIEAKHVEYNTDRRAGVFSIQN